MREPWEPKDWNGGPDCWYYHGGLRQKQLLPRLLMFGADIPSGADIAKGQVYGINVDGNFRHQKVGLHHMNRTPFHW